MNATTFALYVGVAYIAYYSINLLLDFLKSKKPSLAKEEFEDFEVSNIPEEPQEIKKIETDGDLDRFQEKKN